MYNCEAVEAIGHQAGSKCARRPTRAEADLMLDKEEQPPTLTEYFNSAPFGGGGGGGGRFGKDLCP